jgi:hypothetical protein
MEIKLTPLLIHNPFEWKRPLFYASALQREVLGTYFNHGAILVEYPDGKKVVIEAVGHGVIETDYKTWKEKEPKREVWSFIPKTSGDYNFLISQKGKKYQLSVWYSYALFLLSNKLFGAESRLSKSLSNINNPDKWFCFELMLTCFGDAENSFRAGDYIENNYEIIKIDLPLVD